MTFEELEILDRFPLGIILWGLDRDGSSGCFRLREANLTASEFVGFDLQQHLGDSFEAIFTGAEARPLRERWRDQVHGGWVAEPCRVTYGDDRVKRSTFEVRSFPVGDSELMVLFDNVTARVERERRANAIERLSALGRMAGGVAHDFNNLLTVILSNSERLIGLERLEEEARRDAEAIRMAARRGASLTRNLLTISRRQPLEPESVEVNRRLREQEPLITEILGGDIRLEWALTDHPTPVWVDPVQLDQVVLNLTTNARDAMERGGCLRISTEVVEVDEESIGASEHMSPGPHVRLTFEDDGCGMDEATVDHIFEPFFTTKGERGNGIGLATVYGSVTRADGDIRVRSKPGEGTCFEVLLPVGLPKMERIRPVPVPPAKRAGGSRLLLVIDDEPGICRAVRRIVRGEWQTIEAGDADEALAAWDEYGDEIDLVLSDIRLPKVTGGQLIEALEARGLRVPVVFMSGYADRSTLEASAKRAGWQFITKPFESAHLRECLERASTHGRS